MNESRGAWRAGLRGLFSSRVWLDLARAALSLAAIARAIVAVVVLLASVWIALVLPSGVGWLTSLLLPVWLTPVIMRRVSAIVARRVVAARPGASALAPRPLPSTATYRLWWLPLIVCDVALPRLFDWLDVAHGGVALVVSLLALAAAMPGAIVRSVLAPWFAIAEIDRSLAERRAFWALVALAYALSLGVLQWLAIALSAWSGFGGLVEAIRDGSLHEIVSVVALQCAIAIAAFAAIGIFCTSALAWVAATALGGSDVCVPGTFAEPEPVAEAMPSEAQPQEEAAIAPPTRGMSEAARAAQQREWADVLVAHPTPARPPPRAPARPPRPPLSPERVKANQAVARRQWMFFTFVVFAALVLAREALIPWFLGASFRDAVDRHGDWMDLGVRQQVRTDMACVGRTKTLRVLSWSGVDVVKSPQNAALACAAFHGQLDAVETLVALGEDVNRPAAATDSVPQAALQTPLQQAVRTPVGLPVAEWLLAHGARSDGAAEAAADCPRCLAWLKQHRIEVPGTPPADNAGTAPGQGVTLGGVGPAAKSPQEAGSDPSER